MAIGHRFGASRETVTLGLGGHRLPLDAGSSQVGRLTVVTGIGGP